MSTSPEIERKAGMTCDYCGEFVADGDEDKEIITKHAGDESMDICEACYENLN